MMESAEHRLRDHPTPPRCGRREARGDELADALVSAGTVEVARVLPERLEQVGTAVREAARWGILAM